MKKSMIKILMIEDDRIDQMAFERLASTNELPYKYTFACSIEDARACLHSERFDVVLIENSSADRAMLHAIRALPNAPPVILMVSNQYSETISSSVGAVEYVVKDIAGQYLSMLPGMIQQAVQREQLKEIT